jgi:Rod binding domain-containing protein
MKFMEGLSIAGLSEFVIEQLGGEVAPPAAAPTPAKTAEQVKEQVEQLSDDEVSELLQKIMPREPSEQASHESTSP